VNAVIVRMRNGKGIVVVVGGGGLVEVLGGLVNAIIDSDSNFGTSMLTIQKL